MLKVSKTYETFKNYAPVHNKSQQIKKISLKAKLEKLFLTAVLKVSSVFMLQIAEGNAFQR